MQPRGLQGVYNVLSTEFTVNRAYMCPPTKTACFFFPCGYDIIQHMPFCVCHLFLGIILAIFFLTSVYTPWEYHIISRQTLGLFPILSHLWMKLPWILISKSLCVCVYFFMSPEVMSGSRLPGWCGKCMFIFKEPMNFPKWLYCGRFLLATAAC